MGGNATKQWGTERLPNEIYQEVRQHLLEKLNISEKHFYSPVSLPDKVDHGDLDLLSDLTMKEMIDELLKIKDIEIEPKFLKGFTAGKQTICSIPVRMIEPVETPYFQLDLQHILTKSLEHAYYFYSYNDLGAILGLFAKERGLKLGFQGLWWQSKGETRLEKELGKQARIYLSYDFFNSLDTLGVVNEQALTRENFETFFKSKEMLFEWVSKLNGFDPKWFVIDEQEGDRRRRAKKRKNLVEFEAFSKDKEKSPNNLIEISKAELPALIQANKEKGDSVEGYSVQLKYLGLLLAKKDYQRMKKQSSTQEKEKYNTIEDETTQLKHLDQFLANQEMKDKSNLKPL